MSKILNYFTDWDNQPSKNYFIERFRAQEQDATLACILVTDSVLLIGGEQKYAERVRERASSVKHVRLTIDLSDNQFTESGAINVGICDLAPFLSRLINSGEKFDRIVSLGPFDFIFLPCNRIISLASRLLVTGGSLHFTYPTKSSPYAIDTRFVNRSSFSIFTEFDYSITTHASIEPLLQYKNYASRVIPKFPIWIQRHLLDFKEKQKLVKILSRFKCPGYVHNKSTNFDPLEILKSSTDIALKNYTSHHGDIVASTRTNSDGLALEIDQQRYIGMYLYGLCNSATSTGNQDLRDFIRDQLMRLECDRMPIYSIAFINYCKLKLDLDEDLGSFRLEDLELAEDYLALIPAAARYKKYGRPCDKVFMLEAIQLLYSMYDDVTGWINVPSDRNSIRHQNQMYILWGVLDALEALEIKEIPDKFLQVLKNTMKKRLRSDGMVLWYEPKLLIKVKNLVNIFTGRYSASSDWRLLFECHQTFLANTILRLRKFDQRPEIKKIYALLPFVISPLFRAGTDSFHIRDSLPVRCLYESYATGPEVEKFKGVYEIGSYLDMLSRLSTMKELN